MTDRHDAFRTGGEGESSEEPPTGDGSDTPPGVRDLYAADQPPLPAGEEGVPAFRRAAVSAGEVDVTPVDEVDRTADYDHLECAHSECTRRATHWLAAVDDGVRYTLAACDDHRDDFIP